VVIETTVPPITDRIMPLDVLVQYLVTLVLLLKLMLLELTKVTIRIKSERNN